MLNQDPSTYSKLKKSLAKMTIVILWPIQRFQTFLCLPLINLLSHGITVNTSQQSLHMKSLTYFKVKLFVLWVFMKECLLEASRLTLLGFSLTTYIENFKVPCLTKWLLNTSLQYWKIHGFLRKLQNKVSFIKYNRDSCKISQSNSHLTYKGKLASTA